MDKNLKWALTLFSIGVFMAALDNGIISAALTTLIYSFEVSPNWGAWMITLYTLGIAISIPIVGKLSDRYGRKKLFLAEVILFGIGSLMVALSPNFVMFLISRLIQSFGGGGIFIIASSYVLSIFPKEKQGTVLGILGGMNGIAAVLGPNIGAFILDITGSWHWLFLINIPIAIFLIIAGFKFIQESVDERESPLDWGGTIFLSLAILSIMYALTNLDGLKIAESLTSPSVFGFILAGLLFLIILVVIERRVGMKGGDPVLPINLLKRSHYLWTLVIGFFSGAILASVIFIPAYVEQYLGISASKAGYYFTPLALASGIGAGAGGALVDRRGPIMTLVFGSLLSIIGFFLFPIWVTETWQMIIASSLVGLGFGTMLGAPVNVLATENLKGDQGTALGTLSLFRQIGMTIAPTIYAGFIARSFLGVGEEIATRFTAQGMNLGNMPAGEFEKLGEMDYQTLVKQIEQIPVLEVRETILAAIHDVMGRGFNQLYIAAGIVSVMTLISVFILRGIRNRAKGKEENVQLTN